MTNLFWQITLQFKVSEQLPPRKIAPLLGLAFELGLGLDLGLGAMSLEVNCPRTLSNYNFKKHFFI